MLRAPCGETLFTDWGACKAEVGCGCGIGPGRCGRRPRRGRLPWSLMLTSVCCSTDWSVNYLHLIMHGCKTRVATSYKLVDSAALHCEHVSWKVV